MRVLLALALLALSGCYARRYAYDPDRRGYHFRPDGDVVTKGPVPPDQFWVDERFPDGSGSGPALSPRDYRRAVEEDELQDDCPAELSTGM